MNKKTSDLRSAIQALRVSQPLKLPKDGPGLLPPSEVAGKEVPQNEAPFFLPTQKELARIEAPQNSMTKRSEENHIVGDSGEHRNEVAQIGRTQIEVPQKKKPNIEAPPKEVPRNGTTQKGGVQNKVPQFEVPSIEEGGESIESVSGFFKLSHGVFSDPSLRNLSGDCFRLFLWLSARAWRYPTSPGVIRASVRFMEEQTGMSHATVSRALKALKELSLVVLVETDFKRGNVWKISPAALTGRGPDKPTEPDNRPPRNKEAQNEMPQKQYEAGSKNESSSLNLRGELPQKAHNIKKYKNLRKFKKEEQTSPTASEAKICEVGSDESRAVAQKLFETELTMNERQLFIRNYSEAEFPHGFFPPSRILESMAASAWFRQWNSCDLKERKMA